MLTLFAFPSQFEKGKFFAPYRHSFTLTNIQSRSRRRAEAGRGRVKAGVARDRRRAGAARDRRRAGATRNRRRAGVARDRRRAGVAQDRRRAGVARNRRRAGAGQDRRRAGAGQDRWRTGAGWDRWRARVDQGKRHGPERDRGQKLKDGELGPHRQAEGPADGAGNYRHYAYSWGHNSWDR